MDVLKDKAIRSYDNLSRYQQVPFYYHIIDNKYIMGIGTHLKTTTNYIEHEIKENDTLDSLSLKYYYMPTLYWVIADFNRLNDPFLKLPVGYIIKIPTLSDIEFGDY